MRHLFRTFQLLAISLILLSSCAQDPVMVLNLYLSEASFEMPKGGIHQLSAEIYPENADNKSIEWTSADPSLATVSNDGLVTALNVGNTIITAMAADGSGTRAQCNVEVYPCVESVCFDKAEYVVWIGQPVILQANVLPENAKYKELVWSSDDETIAMVDSSGTVRGISEGTCHIVASASNGINAECSVKVLDTVNGHAYVDLGLPSGTLWATMNVGATTPEGYGDYFAWGETKAYGQEDTSNTTNYSYYTGSSSYVKTYYDWSTYKWCNGSNTTMTKYCTASGYGTVDNKTELELADDAAHVNWGGSWHMPTKTQLEELYDKCTQEWTTQSGVNGILVTGPNGNQLFLPAAGHRRGGSLRYEGSYGDYWSSTLSSDDAYYAYDLFFRSDLCDWYYSYRDFGRSVRAVCP